MSNVNMSATIVSVIVSCLMSKTYLALCDSSSGKSGPESVRGKVRTETSSTSMASASWTVCARLLFNSVVALSFHWPCIAAFGEPEDDEVELILNIMFG